MFNEKSDTNCTYEPKNVFLMARKDMLIPGG